jgi:peptidoglycan hydrolase CwlO-like protein
MSNIQIESDLKDILNKFDQKLDKLSGDFSQKLDKLDDKIDKLSSDVTDLKVGQAKIEGKIEALNTKVEQLDKRIGNQEFTNRGVLIGLVVVILGGTAKLFGFMGSP